MQQYYALGKLGEVLEFGRSFGGADVVSYVLLAWDEEIV